MKWAILLVLNIEITVPAEKNPQLTAECFQHTKSTNLNYDVFVNKSKYIFFNVTEEGP